MANEINHVQIPTAIGRPKRYGVERALLIGQADCCFNMTTLKAYIVMGRVRLLVHAGSLHSIISPQSLYMFDCHTIPVSAERGGIIAGMADLIQSQPVEMVGFREKLRAQRPNLVTL